MTRSLLAAVLLAACSTSPGPEAITSVPGPASADAAVVAMVPKAAASAPHARYGGKRWARGLWLRFPARIERAAWCVAGHESLHAGLWRAENPGSGTASGFAQWIDSTFRIHAHRAGVRVRSYHAADVTARKQAAIFAAVWPTSKSAWYGTGCYPGSPTW